MRFKNVYAGQDSTAKIPVVGRVDTAKEILAITYALAYDLANKQLLTRIPGRLKIASIPTVNGRFKVLYNLANKYAKHIVPIIKKFHDLALKRLDGMSEHAYLQSIRKLALQHLEPHLIIEIERRVDMVNDMLHNQANIEQIIRYLF